METRILLNLMSEKQLILYTIYLSIGNRLQSDFETQGHIDMHIEHVLRCKFVSNRKV